MNPTSDSIDLTHFDVRDIPCRVKHAQILQRWTDLPVGAHFILINDHDPMPLYYQFEAQFARAFHWEYLLRGPEEFQVKITRLAPSSPVTRAVEATTESTGEQDNVLDVRPIAPRLKHAQIFERWNRLAPLNGDTLEVDARGLEPPEPLMRILNALETLPVGVSLRAITDREPCHLFGEALQRGFLHDCKAQPDGSWHTQLARA